MAIQLRRGAYADFDPTKMVPAEVGIVTSGDPNTDDGKAAYVAFSAGNAKRLATVEDIATDLQEATDDAVGQATARAEAAAESVEASAAQIATNTADIADLKADNSELKNAISNTITNTELQNGYKTYKATYAHGWISGSGVYNPSDNRYISNGIPTSDIVEVVNNSNVTVYVDYFTQFTDFTSFQLATYTQLNPGQSTLIDRYYPTVCVLSSATQESGLEGLLIKGASQLEYLSKTEHDDIVSDLDSFESEFVELFTDNAFLATSYTMNGYWNLSNHGVFKADSNYVAVNDYMPVDAGATYYCGAYNKTTKGREISAIPGIYIYYDANKAYAGSEQGTKTSITIPSGVKYLRVSITANTYNSYLCGLRKGSPMDYWYPPFKKVLSSDLDRVVTVGKNGSEDFYYLKEAVEFATRYDGITVKVNPGTYDLAAEYGSAWLEAMTSTQAEKGLVLKNNIHLVFSPLAVVTFHYRGENTNVQTRFSPFNSGEKGFVIEGLTLKASNCRYCVHDERSGGTEPYTNKYINCDFDFDNSLNTAWSASQIIGGGLGKQGSILIENCVFYTYRTPFVVANAVSYHNHAQADSKSIVVVKGCYFKENNGMRFSWYGTSTLITQILVSNNSMGRAIETRAETQDSTTENINVIAWNNELRT